MRIVFAGTPDPAVVALERLYRSGHEVAAVITRPDARRGRGRGVHPSPVKALALSQGTEVLTPASLKADTEDGKAVRERLAQIQPECVPVVAYGALVPPDLLAVPTHGWVNVHYSLLPAWRGAAPVQAAIRSGEDITGVSVFQLEEGLDTGPVLGTVTEKIGPDDTSDDLFGRLAPAGAELLVRVLDGLEAGAVVAVPQQGVASYAPKITVAEARVNWADPALAIDRQVRAYTPSPGAWAMCHDTRLKIGQLLLATEEQRREFNLDELAPGELLATKRSVFVGTGSGAVELKQVQPSGKKMMDAAAWVRGIDVTEGIQLQ